MFQKKILNNGLRLLTVPMQGVDTVTTLILINVGSRHENKKNNGIAHLIEHLAFKGTKKRPNLFAISRELDSIGADYNAFTSEEYTGYYVKSRAVHLSKGLELLTDIIANPLYREENILEEEKVIIEEIRMYQDSPTHFANQLMQNILFAGNPLGYDIAGSEDSVSRINKKQILDFRAQNYLTNKMVIIIAGKIEYNLDKINQFFAGLAHKSSKKPAPFKPATNPKRIIIDGRKTKQAHLRLGVLGLCLEDPDRYALDLLHLILGGSMSSRLFEEVREKRSLAYYVNTAAESYQDTGLFVVQAGLNTEKLEEAIKVINHELRKSIKMIKDEELSRAKEILKGEMAMEREDSYELARFFGFQALLESRIKTYEELTKMIDSQEKSDIKRVAGKLFNQDYYLALVGQGSEERLSKLINK